jgi:2-phospho-L-lactate guanylyltransferase (CobY/MobA/RfbA family)
VVVAPDRRKTGTNALFLRPPGVMDYAFGENSYDRHRAQGAQAGARVRLCHLPGVALDIDTLDDLSAYREISRHPPHDAHR